MPWCFCLRRIGSPIFSRCWRLGDIMNFFNKTALAYSVRHSIQPTKPEQSEGPSWNLNFYFAKVSLDKNTYLIWGRKHGIVFHLIKNRQTIRIHSNSRSKKIFSKIYKKRKMTYTSSTKTLPHLSQPFWYYKLCFVLKTTTVPSYFLFSHFL